MPIGRVITADGPEPSVSSPNTVTDIAGVTRAEWQRFLEFYRPIENQVLERAMQTDFSREGDIASQTVTGSIRASQGSLERELRRRGTSLTTEERRALTRRTGTTLTRGAARAENTTRRTLSDNRTNLVADIVGIGRGVAQTATGGLSSVADMAAQREALFRQQQAQARSQRTSALATAAGLAIAFL